MVIFGDAMKWPFLAGLCRRRGLYIVAVPRRGGLSKARIRDARHLSRMVEVNGRLMTSPCTMTTQPDHNIGSPARKAARPWRMAACAGLAMLALSGCAENEGFKAGCPNVGILRDAGTLRTDQGVAVLSGIFANCAYDDTHVRIAANLDISGRVNEGGSATSLPVTYFVSVVDPNRNVITKKNFSTTIPLNGGKGMVQETLEQTIPVPKTVDARWYEVLVGFQITPEQADANRATNEGR